ncbi:MAG TPA: ArsR family transcriptional regulator, partial [Cupriavidus sp.]|nr:ArsR family transcriptional regulator [Cupriavidus sp.]
MTSRKHANGDNAQNCATNAQRSAPELLALSHSDVAVLAETFLLLGDQSRLKILLQCMRGSVAVG